MNFTDSQAEAIRWNDGSVLVSAGAGSGKTRVLTERLMRYITEGEDVNRFLVITFTRAAAAELRGRIAKGITDRLQENPGDAHLRRQLLLVRAAQIGTIHSFCATLLREYAGELGISPTFRILEEEQSERLRVSALQRVLESAYQEADPDFLALADTVGAGRDDRRMENLLLRLHTQIRSHGHPDYWVRNQLQALESLPEHAADTPWGREYLSDLQEELDEQVRMMEEATAEIESDPGLDKAYGDSFRETLRALRTLCGQMKIGWDETVNCFPIPYPRLYAPGKTADRTLAEAVKAVRTGCKKTTDRMEDLFSETEAVTMSRQAETMPAMRALLQLTQKLETEFQTAKRRSNGLDYSDLEHECLRLLETEEGTLTTTAVAVSKRFREVMVDEYQDVSRVQDSIFHAVSRDGDNLFFVGDLKQSIYRFRLADPGIFTEKSKALSLIRLQENFRSTPAILEAVNRVFSRCMSEKLGDLNYAQADFLIPGDPAREQGTEPEFYLIRRENASGSDLEAEAELVAEKAAEMIRSGRKPGEIAILLRSANSVGSVFRSALLRRGIPVNAGAGEEFYSSHEVSVVFAFLSLLDNPHKDIPLLTVLRSPAFGFTADRLAEIRAAYPESDYYTALQRSNTEDARHFLKLFSELRVLAADLRPVSLVYRVIEELGLVALCAAMQDSEARLKRLADLSVLAERFEAGGEQGLHRFVLWLQNKERKGEEPGTVADSGESVSILSIHRSKGLEFPVVFYCALARQFNKADTRDTVLIHPRLGFGPKYTDPKRKIEFPTVSRRAIERFLNRELLSEEMRLLYVAMTRAKERLVMTACVKKADELAESAVIGREKLSPYQTSAASAPLQWLLAALPATVVDPPEAKEERLAQNTAAGAVPNEALLEHLREQLTYRYPHEEDVMLPSKLTASALEDREAFPMIPVSRPRLQMPDPSSRLHLSGARRGTAMHAVLQYIAFEKTGSLIEIEDEIVHLRERGFLSAEEAASVSAEEILRFFRSGIGSRIRHARDCRREFRFSLLTEARQLLPDVRSDEKILLQGVVDCCFVEEDALTLVDSKTDRIPRPEIYRGQLDAYAKAISRIFQLPVREKVLYFLSTGDTVVLT